MIKTKEEISDLYKKTFKHSQFIEHSKIEDFIHQIRQDDLNAIKAMILNKFNGERTLEEELAFSEIIKDLDNLNKE